MTRSTATRMIGVAAVYFTLTAPSALAWKVDGTVLTRQYWPVAGALVSIAFLPDGAEIETSVSDDLGNYEFDVEMPDGQYRISMAHPDFLPQSVEERIRSNKTVYFFAEACPKN